MSDESEFIDINAEIKLFEHMLKEDGYHNTQKTIHQLAQDGEKMTEEKIENSLNYNILSNEEKQFITQINQTITIEDSTSVLQYGIEAQTKIARFTDNILKRIKNKNTEEVGHLLIDFVTEIKSLESNIIESKPKFFNFFKNTNKQFEKLIAKYNTMEKNIDTIEQKLENHKVQMLKDIIIFDKMYEKNLEHFKEISFYIIAGDKKIEELNVQLKKLNEKAIQTKKSFDTQQVHDMKNTIHKFEKKIHDLKMTRIISIQMAPQIKLLQNNESELIEKIQLSLTNTIPLWKNQIILALGISDIETLKKTNQDILKTLDQIIKIHNEDKQKRLETEKSIHCNQRKFETNT